MPGSQHHLTAIAQRQRLRGEAKWFEISAETGLIIVAMQLSDNKTDMLQKGRLRKYTAREYFMENWYVAGTGPQRNVMQFT